MTTQIFTTLVLALTLGMGFAEEEEYLQGKGKIIRRMVDGLMVVTETGVEKVPFAELSPEIQKKFGYDPKAAEFLRKAQEASRLAGEIIRADEAAAETRLDQWKKRAKDLQLIADLSGKKEDRNDSNSCNAKIRDLRWLVGLMDKLGQGEDVPKLLKSTFENQVYVGMPEIAVNISWGKPDDVNATLRKSGRSEQWIYRKAGNRSSYLYVENGVVTSIQE